MTGRDGAGDGAWIASPRRIRLRRAVRVGRICDRGIVATAGAVIMWRTRGGLVTPRSSWRCSSGRIWSPSCTRRDAASSSSGRPRAAPRYDYGHAPV